MIEIEYDASRWRSSRGLLPCILVSSLAMVSLLAGACASENAGVEPERDAFYFPTGLDLDPTRQLLYVTNSNADLRFSGGTLMAVDLSRLPVDLSNVGDEVNAKKLNCAPARTDPTTWECPEDQFIIDGATVRLGDFPNEVRVNGQGTRVFVPVRGENYLLWADVVDLPDGTIDLRCNDDPQKGCARAGASDCPVWDCDEAHRINFSDRLQQKLPAEPFGILYNKLVAVHIDEAGQRHTCLDGVSQVGCSCGSAPLCSDSAPAANCCIEPSPLDHVYVAHLSGGEVSFFTSSPSGVELVDFTGGFFSANAGIRGGFSLAASLPGDALSPVYVSSRVDSLLGSFIVRDNTNIVRTQRVSIGAVSPGNDVRGIAFGPGGNVLYALDRLPSSLVALDIAGRADESTAGDPLWAVEVCDGPSLLRLGPDPARPQAGSAALAFVVCFNEAQLFVVDTERAIVIDSIVTGQGPNAMVIDSAHQRAFIANFAENTIGVIDLDPAHVTYRKMVLRIGLAEKAINDQ